MMTPPVRMLRTARIAVSIDLVKMPVCRPNRLSLTERKTWSMSSYGKRLTTGPNTSSHTTFMVGLTPASTVGSVCGARGVHPAALAAGEDFCAAARRVIDPGLHALRRALVDQRADIGRRVHRIA